MTLLERNIVCPIIVPYRLTIVHAKYYLPLYHSRPIFACACAIVDVRNSNSWVCMCNGACSSTHRKLHTVSWKGISNTLPSDFVIFKAMLCPNFVHTEGDG